MTIRGRITAAIVAPLVALLALFLLLVTRQVLAQRQADVDEGLRTRAAALAGHMAYGEHGWLVDFEGGTGPAPDVVRDLAAWQVQVYPDGEVLEAQELERLGGPIPLDEAVANGRETWSRPLLVGEPRRLDRSGTLELRVWTGLFLVRVERGDVEMVRSLPPDLPTAPTVQVTVARDMGPVHAQTRALLGEVLLLGLAGALLALALGRWLAARVVRPIEARAREAEAVQLPLFEAPLATAGNGDELDRLTSTLNAAFQRAHDAWERQARFTSDASHELRTPLSVIRSEVEIALRSDHEPETREAFESVLAQAARMQATLEQLLCLARADAGVPGRDVEVELLGICREVIDEVRAEHPGAPPVTVEGDAVLLRCDPVSFGMIVRNLIENAVRHTPTDGSVDVHLRTGADGVHLQVRDTGEGIPAASLPHVFERFHQAEPFCP